MVDVIDPHLFVVVLPLLIALATVARVEIYLQQRRCIFCDSQDLTKASLNSQDKTKLIRPEKRPTRLEKGLTRQGSQGKTHRTRQDATHKTGKTTKNVPKVALAILAREEVHLEHWSSLLQV